MDPAKPDIDISDVVTSTAGRDFRNSELPAPHAAFVLRRDLRKNEQLKNR